MSDSGYGQFSAASKCLYDSLHFYASQRCSRDTVLLNMRCSNKPFLAMAFQIKVVALKNVCFLCTNLVSYRKLLP